MVFGDENDHVFEAFNVSFPVRLFGQSLTQVLITSAGGILTSGLDNNKNSNSHIELPNHIAPFLTNFPPNAKEDIVYYSDKGTFTLSSTCQRF